jgi:hypothetical protein
MIAFGRWAALSLATALWAGAATAQTASGMIMEVSGTTEPAVQALSEVEPGFTVMLTPGAKMSFVHYQSCKLVSVEGGGLVTLRLTAYTVEAKVLSEQKRCPKRFAMATGGSTEAGALVVRGGVTKLSNRPIFLLTGAGADGVAGAELMQDGKLVAPLQFSARRASPPDSTLPLRGQYEVVVKGRGGQSAVRKFEAAELGADPLERTVVLALE